MLAKPKPEDATPMSAEKAKAIVIDKNKRELAKIQAAYQARKKARMALARAKVNKNSAFCPDRPSPDDETTTGPLRAWHGHATDDADQCLPWSTDGPAAGGSLQGGQETPSRSRWPQRCSSLHMASVLTQCVAAKNLGIEVVGGSEVDPKLAAAFTQRTGAPSYPGLEQLIEGGDRGQYPELHNLDIVTSGLPCPFRSNAGSLTSRRGKAKREAGTNRHLFTKQVEFYRIFKPRSVMIEQPPPSHPHMQDYIQVIEGMCKELARSQFTGTERAGAGGFCSAC
jgi:hypothetical protein